MRWALLTLVLGLGSGIGLWHAVQALNPHEQGYTMAEVMEMDKLVVDIIEGVE